MNKFKRYFYITIGIMFLFTIYGLIEVNRQIANDLSDWAKTVNEYFVRKANKLLSK